MIGLFFLRFWRNTRDRLFGFFAAAFWVLGLDWVALVVVRPSDEARHIIYLVRVVAFLLLSYGIIDKNITANRK